MDYKLITVQDLINAVKANPKLFPKGLNTPVLSGDFEGNDLHEKHEIQADNIKVHKIGRCIVLGYEMHENVMEDF